MVPGRKAVFLAGLLVGAGGTWLGRQFLTTRSPIERAEMGGQPSSTPPALSLDAIRAAVRDEIRQDLPRAIAAAAPRMAIAHPGTTSPAEDRTKPHPAEAGPSQHYNEARNILENALANGAWADADREQLRTLLPELNPAEREQLMKRLIVSANRGEIRVGVTGPLF